MSDIARLDPQPSLVDVLDRLLDTGVVLDGQIVISLAGVDLVHIGLRALVASIETAGRLANPGAAGAALPDAVQP